MYPRPEFFIVRPGANGAPEQPGSIIPLVAVDQLPEWIDIVGVPRELPIDQTIGLCNLGVIDKEPGVYAVRIIDPSSSYGEPPTKPRPVNAGSSEKTGTIRGLQASRHAESNSDDIVNDKTSDVRDARAPRSPPPAPPPSPAPAQTQTQTHQRIDWATLATLSDSLEDLRLHDGTPPVTSSTKTGTTTPSNPTATATPSSSTKTTASSSPSLTSSSSSTSSSSGQTQTTTTSNQEFCRHWCRHGQCKWGSQCRHRHAMPTTVEGLLRVGLDELPAWWITAVATMGGYSGPCPPSSYSTSSTLMPATTTTSTGSGGTTHQHEVNSSGLRMLPVPGQDPPAPVADSVKTMANNCSDYGVVNNKTAAVTSVNNAAVPYINGIRGHRASDAALIQQISALNAQKSGTAATAEALEGPSSSSKPITNGNTTSPATIPTPTTSASNNAKKQKKKAGAGADRQIRESIKLLAQLNKLGTIDQKEMLAGLRRLSSQTNNSEGSSGTAAGQRRTSAREVSPRVRQLPGTTSKGRQPQPQPARDVTNTKDVNPMVVLAKGMGGGAGVVEKLVDV